MFDIWRRRRREYKQVRSRFSRDSTEKREEEEEEAAVTLAPRVSIQVCLPTELQKWKKSPPPPPGVK